MSTTLVPTAVANVCHHTTAVGEAAWSDLPGPHFVKNPLGDAQTAEKRGKL